MSRTDGIHLPRVPTSHIRVTSSDAVQYHPKKGKHSSTLSEPHYTAYIGTPRQDVPGQVYRDAAMFDDVFDRQGRLFTGRNTPKIISPLNSLEYSSLHDPHCQQLFLNNMALRNHLISLGMLTDDLRVVANTRQQREKVRSHELLERKETLKKNMDERERQRKERLQKQIRLPAIYQESLAKEEARKARQYTIERKKLEKQRELQNIEKRKEAEKKQEKKKKLQEVLEQINLIEQVQRNVAVYEQQRAEIDTYLKRYGKTAVWHRESDRIHNRMVYLQRMKWSAGSKNKVADDKFKVPKLLHDPPTATDTPPLKEQPGTDNTEMEDDRSKPPYVGEEGEGEKDKVVSDGLREKEVHQLEDVDSKEEDKVSSSTLTTEVVQGVTDSEKESKESPQEVVTSDSDAKEVQPLDKKVKDNVTTTTTSTVTTTSGEESESTSEIERPVVPLTIDPAASMKKLPLLSQQDSLVAIANVFFDILRQFDTAGTGYIQMEAFYNVMTSPDLALPLDRDEVLLLTDYISNNGWVPLEEGTGLLPSLLINLFQDRLRLQIEQYSKYIEDRWLQLSSPNIGYIYLDKTTGLVQKGVRPPDYRPYLKNDLFEDVIVEFFETADTNRDGYVDQNEIYIFLQSADISSRIYAHQIDELYKVYMDQSVEGTMVLEQFVPFAHVILQMIYSNSYPDQEWVELQSRKCGKYFFNPGTGETKLPNAVPKKSEPATPKRKSRSRRRRRESKDTATTPKPPPLRKKSSVTSTKTDFDVVEEIRIEPISKEEAEGKTSRPSSSKQEEQQTNNDVDTNNETSLAEQVADRLQKGLRIIETIEEDQEEEDDNNMEQAEKKELSSSTMTATVRGQSTAREDERDSIDSAIDRVMEKVLDENLND